MNFRPSDPDRVLHDTWVFLEGDIIHLFYLAPEVDSNSHRLIGHAVSEDWLHWSELPFIELTGPPGTWDSGRIGTGHVFEDDEGRYCMAYTGRIDPQEDIGLAVSDDLLNWRKPFKAPVCPQHREPPYEDSRSERGDRPAWRDPFVVRDPDGCRYAYLTARTDRGASSGRGCVARARIDEPDQWTTLKPVAATGDYPVMEVPEVFEFGQRWWLTFNTHSEWGRRLDTTSRRRAAGTFYLSAPQIDGPWEGPADNMLIGSGEGRRDAVVARSIEYRGERLVYHHYTGPFAAGTPRALGLPKVLEHREDRLLLRPWASLSSIWRGEMPATDWQPLTAEPWAHGSWHVAPPQIEGECAESVAACRGELEMVDLDLEVALRISGGERAGLILGTGAETARGVCVLLDALRDEVTIGHPRTVTYGIILDATLDRHLCEINTGVVYDLRVLRRDCYAEVFLQDELIFSSIVGPAGEGQPWLCVVLDRCAAQFEFGRISSLEPMGYGAGTSADSAL